MESGAKRKFTVEVTLVIRKGSNETKVVRLRSEETVIGRQSGCELRIPSAAVSRRHCRLSFRDDVLSVEDLDSANGTLVNGERIEGIRALRPGDSLEVGPVVFTVKYQLTPEAEERLAQEGEAPVDAQELEFADDMPEVDVQELEIEEVTEIDEERPPAKKPKKKKSKSSEEDSDTRHEPTEHLDAEKAKKPAKSPAAKKKPEKPGKKATPPPQESLDPDVAAMLDGEASWHMPAGDDFRDFLNQMEDT